MKLLTAIFSYNRFYLLRNAVESFFEFGPGGDLLIVDDGSNDPRIAAYLSQIQEEKRATVIFNTGHKKDFTGGLYNNMNRAIEYSLQFEYSHVFFVQDDIQFMWRDIDFQKRVEEFFSSCLDASMVSFVFQKGIVRHMLPERLELASNGLAWSVRPYGVLDQGVMPLSLIRKQKFRFGQRGERENPWRQWGYKAYLAPEPIFAFVPWPNTWRFDKPSGNEKKPAQKYFLKPLTEQQTKRLHSMGMDHIAYHEDFCFPWGWRCLSPYWFTKKSFEYIKLLMQGLLSGKGFVPRMVGKK